MTKPHFSASCQGHFGELLQGMFLDDCGKPVRGLVTLPCPQLQSRAELSRYPDGATPLIKPNKPKVTAIAKLYCQQYGVPADFSLEISSNIPVAVGMGSSTADLIATLRVLDRAFGVVTDVNTLLQMVLQVEKACDPTLLAGNALLFAQREGRIVEDFGAPLPPLSIRGFDLMPGQVFETDKVAPADYTKADLLCFTELRAALRDSLQRQDVAGMAAVATQSALINQRYFPKPGFDDLLTLQVKTGALGVCVAHSGTVAGLMFAGTDAQQAGVALSMNGLLALSAPEKPDNVLPLFPAVQSSADARYPA